MRTFIYLLAVSLLIFNACKIETAQDYKHLKDSSEFTFAFMTDIHLQPEKDAVAGFKMAIDSCNKLKPDFVITGGDLIMDALGQSYGRSDSLYNLYQQTSALIEAPVYNTLGNHELYGLYERSHADTLHEEYFRKMYEKRIGKRYYAFNHKGWRFYIFDSVDKTNNRRYIGSIDQEQIKWLKEDLKSVDPSTPIAITVHIPLITALTQINKGSMEANTRGLVVENTKEILDIFKNYKLKLVLQGHLHIVEDIFINDMHFITGGAVSAAWWSGAYHGMEEGFMNITLNKDGLVKWDYIDYGWEAKQEE